MKEVVREYGHMVISIAGTYVIVKMIEYFMLGRNGIAEILFKLFA